MVITEVVNVVMYERIQLEQEYNVKLHELQMYADQVAIINEKIERLQQLKMEFIEHKHDLIQLQNKLVTFSKEDTDEWMGDRRRQYKDLLKDEVINGSLNDYINKWDQNLDELNNELVRLQNELYRTENLISSIKSILHNLSTQIENLVN